MERKTEPSYIVGIGASAGGLEALEQLFRHMPEQTGMAFVVVQHLSPHFKSQMDDLLARWTRMPILVAKHEMPVEPNTIYLMPANREMIIAGGQLLITERSHILNLPIDQFLRSLAQDVGSHAIGVILSGTGSDGSRGVQEIHEHDGLVVVQSEQTAKFDGMPKSAIETGAVDFILPPEDIPAALLRHAHGIAEGTTDIALPDPVKEGGMRAIFDLLRKRYNIDFFCYKPATIARRTERRLQLNQFSDLNDYIEKLRSDRVELDALYEDLLIGVTEFFRDEEAFLILENQVLPDRIARLPHGGELRVWCAGCATGEEAYSLAILVAEAIESSGASDAGVGAKIFATDVHRSSLEVASAGIYSRERLANVSAERLARFFVSFDDDSYRVSPQLRKMIVFTSHNVIRDAPFTKLDLISCRNLLIYLQPNAQRKAMSLFHFGLKTGGALFLGPSESPGDVAEEFEEIDRRWRIYSKRRDVRLLPGLRTPMLLLSDGPSRPSPASSRRSFEPQLLEVFGALLEDSLPASVLVNNYHEVIHTFGDISSFLRLPRGRPSLSLLDMIEGDLKLAIAGALHRAALGHKTVWFTGVQAKTLAGSRPLDLSVTPVHTGHGPETFFLVSLKDSEESELVGSDDESLDLHLASRDRMEALELDLRRTKENLQATIEELEASNEELQSTNEELLAANEELQSTNEELQSVNEELYTVNAERQKKIDELTMVTDDMNNLLVSTDVHTLFLDEHLCIRKFTPKIAEVFNLVPHDVGRRIDGFAHTIEIDNLAERLARVIATDERHEAEVRSTQGTWYLMRLLPYRGHGSTFGVVLTLIDIDKIKQWEAALREQVRQRDEFLAMLSHELRNPLSGTLNALALLRRKVDDPDKVRSLVELIERQSKHMGRLLDDLLDVSRITHGKIALRKEVCDARRLIHEAVEGVRLGAELLDHTLEVDLPDESIWIDADAARILQVLDNLLTNAVKYTPAGGHIRASIAQKDGVAEIQVRDNGRGIDAQTLGRIFDMFVQGENSLDRSSGGLGVGLTLVRNLVEMHGGQVTVDSRGPGYGSVFTVILPLTAAPPEHDAEPAPMADASPDATGSPDAAPDAAKPADAAELPRLVLVEDQPGIREPLVEMLAEDGYEIASAADGKAGLQLILEKRPDVALLDIGLPDLDGYEIARRVRQIIGPDDIYLIALTGYGRTEDHSAVLDAGFDDHLIKPVMPEDIVAALGRRHKP